MIATHPSSSIAPSPLQDPMNQVQRSFRPSRAQKRGFSQRNQRLGWKRWKQRARVNCSGTEGDLPIRGG